MDASQHIKKGLSLSFSVMGKETAAGIMKLNTLVPVELKDSIRWEKKSQSTVSNCLFTTKLQIKNV